MTFVADTASALAGTYLCTPEAERPHCSRSLPGDQFFLSYTRRESGGVLVRLEARPD